MKRSGSLLYNSTGVLAILSTGFLLYSMLAMLIFKKQIFFEREVLSTAEMFILVGFVLIVLFDLVSLLWVLLRIPRFPHALIGDKLTLLFGGLCLILLLGEKTMIDEIGREYLMGWEVLGEWIILYLFLTTQLAYNLVILLQWSHARRRLREEKP